MWGATHQLGSGLENQYRLLEHTAVIWAVTGVAFIFRFPARVLASACVGGRKLGLLIQRRNTRVTGRSMRANKVSCDCAWCVRARFRVLRYYLKPTLGANYMSNSPLYRIMIGKLFLRMLVISAVDLAQRDEMQGRVASITSLARLSPNNFVLG